MSISGFQVHCQPEQCFHHNNTTKGPRSGLYFDICNATHGMAAHFEPQNRAMASFERRQLSGIPNELYGNFSIGLRSTAVKLSSFMMFMKYAVPWWVILHDLNHYFFVSDLSRYFSMTPPHFGHFPTIEGPDVVILSSFFQFYKFIKLFVSVLNHVISLPL